MANVNTITDQLAKTKVDNDSLQEKECEVSFSGKGLRLDTEERASPVIQAIDNCETLTTLRLDGNTIGVDAAKGIAKALEKHPEFQRALWSDIFTGRLKTEIPQALTFFSLGITMANAHLKELDLSDNAFGPAGVEAVTELLKSPSGFSLQELRFNNNGLGIGGGKILAKALLDCYKACSAAGLIFNLKVFIAGRNRLENGGAKALAEAFETIGTLEEVVMPQNGIYHEGISALADAFAYNKDLKILNLNDNTFTPIGAVAMAKALPYMQNLEVINFGDCLLRTEGAQVLANALKCGQIYLKELHLNNNEISSEGGYAIARSLQDKKSMIKLELDGNQFGEEGSQSLQNLLEGLNLEHILGSLSDDEGEDNEDEDEESDGEDESDNTDDNENKNEAELNAKVEIKELKDNDDDDEDKENADNNIIQKIPQIESEKQVISVSEFLRSPSAKGLLELGSHREELILSEMGDDSNDYNKVMSMIIKLSLLLEDSNQTTQIAVCKCIDAVLIKVFNSPNVNIPLISNCILVYLGLIKSEDKIKAPPNLTGPLIALQHVASQTYFPKCSREILQVFLSRPFKVLDSYMQERNQLLHALYQS